MLWEDTKDAIENHVINSNPLLKFNKICLDIAEKNKKIQYDQAMCINNPAMGDGSCSRRKFTWEQIQNATSVVPQAIDAYIYSGKKALEIK